MGETGGTARGLPAALADAAVRLGVGDLAFSAYQRLQAFGAPQGPPHLPPPYLRVLTAGDADAHAFEALGRAMAGQVASVAERHCQPLAGGAAVLDFGCGCGRVAQALLAESAGVRLSGCDINPLLIGWCRRNLPGDYRVTAMDPPLPYGNGAFRLVYALSVFTHFHRPTARAWLAELARVTAPGGLAVLSFFDERQAAAGLDSALRRDGFAIKRDGAEGGNLMCGYYTAFGFAADAAPAWTLLEAIPSNHTGVGQALAVLQRA